MSTKNTVLHAREPADFHLYRECGDHDNLHLVLHTGPHKINLVIPLGVAFAAAEKISSIHSIYAQNASATEAEIRQIAAEEVEARIIHKGDKLAVMMGLLVYGDVDDPPEVQIERGVKSMSAERDRAAHHIQTCRRLLGEDA
jgi:hypothetical protein